VSLLTGEFRVSLDFCVQISGEDVLDLHGAGDVLGSAVGKLNPIVKEIVGDPVNELVDSSATLFNVGSEDLTLIIKTSTEHPVVLLSSINFTNETDLVSSTHDTQTLDGVLELVGVLFSEANVSPFKHLSLFSKVGKADLFGLGYFLFWSKADTVHQVFAFLDVH
jgi:hypothetical protein